MQISSVLKQKKNLLLPSAIAINLISHCIAVRMPVVQANSSESSESEAVRSNASKWLSEKRQLLHESRRLRNELNDASECIRKLHAERTALRFSAAQLVALSSENSELRSKLNFAVTSCSFLGTAICAGLLDFDWL